MQLGIVTYNIAKDWDLDTILNKLEKLGYAGVELRTTHKHGVETSLSPKQRAEVRKKLDDSPVELAGLGSAFEFQSPDPEIVRKNIEGTKEYVRLAHDLGSPGVKVRPNGLPKGSNPDDAYKRIGDALNTVGEDAIGFGVEIRVEVHGGVTQNPDAFVKIMDHAKCSNVYVCWNSNPTDISDQGSAAPFFQRVAPRIREVHLRDLFDQDYPWRELFELLAKSNYQGYTLAEIPESSDPDRVLRYFRALWIALQYKLA